MAIPGIVYTKYLKPIQPNEATDREHMLRIVRRRILECLADAPPEASRSLKFSEKLECFFALIVSLSVCLSLIFITSKLILFTFPTLSTKDLLIGGGIGSVIVTIVVYLWAAYIQIWIHPHVPTSSSSTSSNSSRSSSSKKSQKFESESESETESHLKSKRN